MSRQAQKGVVAAALVAAVAICAAGATAGREAAAPSPGYKVVGKIGKDGKGNGQFSANAYGVATDKAGNVYVADSGDLRIQALSAKGAYKAQYPFAPGENVIDVAVGPTGDVWGTADVLSVIRRFPAGGGAPQDLPTAKASNGIAVDADDNVYASISGDEINAVVRFAKSEAGWGEPTTWVGSGFGWPGDIEVSADGSIYVADKRGSPPSIKRYDASGKLLNTIKTKLQATAGAGAQYGIAVDPDCNVWATNGEQRRVDRFSPAGKLLASVTSGDLLSTDMAVGPTGDLYVFDIYTHGLVRFAKDGSKPGAALVSARLTAANKVVKVKYTLASVACPAQIDAVATLTGSGIAGKAAVKVAAGKATTITIPLTKAASGPAKFTIVLKTNGSPTTQVAAVSVTAR
jgi:streptogramin lyase